MKKVKIKNNEFVENQDLYKTRTTLKISKKILIDLCFKFKGISVKCICWWIFQEIVEN